MNIYYLSDNMARLTPTTGSIRHVLSNRTYKEVRCKASSPSSATTPTERWAPAPPEPTDFRPRRHGRPHPAAPR